MSNLSDFEAILETECNLKHLIINRKIKNLDDFVRDEADAHLWSAGLLNVKEKVITYATLWTGVW